MGIDLIISYDGTPNDEDALALGKMLSAAGGSLALAYVRHVREFDPRREEIAQHDAEQLLDRGAQWLGDPSIAKHVVVSASTSDGLAQIAAEEGAAAIVFGSEYRTPPGRAEPGMTAQLLLEGGPVAIAIAAAGLRLNKGAAIQTIAAPQADVDPVAAQTAEFLAQALGASINGTDRDSDLIIVGSQTEAPSGTVTLGGSTRSMLDIARGSVLALTQGTPLLA